MNHDLTKMIRESLEREIGYLESQIAVLRTNQLDYEIQEALHDEELAHALNDLYDTKRLLNNIIDRLMIDKLWTSTVEKNLVEALVQASDLNVARVKER